MPPSNSQKGEGPPQGAGQLAEKTVPKLSKKPRGHWRSRWRSQKDCEFSDRMEKAGTWLGRYCWPTAEIAEQKAMEWLAKHKDVAKHYGIEFRGVVFFPAGSEGDG